MLAAFGLFRKRQLSAGAGRPDGRKENVLQPVFRVGGNARRR